MNMLRSTFLVLSLAIVHITTAQLAPERPATTGEHLLVVNAEWATMDPTALLDDQVVSFTSETERIAEHLHRVAERLAARPLKDIASSPAQRRRMLLDTLSAYADRSMFPKNHDAPGRTPVFIDEDGTACAVGQLMISSGHAELAHRIHNEMNLAYIKDISLPEVEGWASTHGFSLDELAWIQPTYQHMKPRDPGLLAAVHLVNGDLFEVRQPAADQVGQKLNVVLKNANGSKVVATMPALSGVQAMEFAGRVFVGGTPPQHGAYAAVFEWNGKKLVAHDPFNGRVRFAGFYLTDGALHARGYVEGETTYQDRYLTPAGEWMVTRTGTSAEPVPIEMD